MRSQELALQREDFDKTLKELKRLARTTPEAVDEPEGVLAARSFEDALKAMDWHARFDAHGDLVGLASLRNKLIEGPVTTVSGSEKLKPAPLASVLAKTAHGSFVVASEEAANCVVLQHGRAHAYDFASYAFERIGDEKGVPGETTRLRFRLVGAVPAEQVSVHLVRALGRSTLKGPWQGMLGVERIELDESPMQPGDERDLTLHLSPDLVGSVRVCVCARSSKTFFRSCTMTIEVDEPPGPDEWHVIEQTPARPHYVMLGRRDSERALVLAQRFAARYGTEPGGAFLRDVAAATSLAEVFEAAHLDGTLQSRPSVLRIGRDRLPGPERLFWGLQSALQVWVAPKWSLGIHELAELAVRYAHAPQLRYLYRIGSGGTRSVEMLDDGKTSLPAA